MSDSKSSVDETNRKAILAALDALSVKSIQDDTLTFEGDRFVIPAGMTASEAAEWLRRWERNQEETFQFSRTFPYRPWDGAAAFDRACKRVFGSGGLGKAQVSMFGSQPPAMISIETAPGQTVQVPWGEIEMPAIEASFYTGADRTREHGMVFMLSVTAPKKHRARIEGFFEVVADELAMRSIYRGKAITGGEEPVFLDLSVIDPQRVVYSADTMTQLNANLWALIEHSDTMRALGIPLKRAVLLEGPWGTGKTMSGALTGQRATANGWTYILARPGQDDLLQTMKTAQLYAPAVVWFEDIDVAASDATAQYISRLLDTLDGVSAKGREVVVGFTTNYVDRIAKGMLRPGRIDAVVHFGELESADVERLVRITVPAGVLAEHIEWEKVQTAFTGYVPAFAKEAIDRAMRYTIARNGGKVGTVDTGDLVSAAQGLRAQLRLMDEADEGTRSPSLDSAFRTVVDEAVAGLLNRTDLPDHEDSFYVAPLNPNS
jgi:hypothetical protein